MGDQALRRTQSVPDGSRISSVQQKLNQTRRIKSSTGPRPEFQLGGIDSPRVSWRGEDGAGKTLVVYDKGKPIAALQGADVDEDSDLTDLDDLSDDDFANDDEPNKTRATIIAEAKQACIDLTNLDFSPIKDGLTPEAIQSRCDKIRALAIIAVKPWIRHEGRPGLNSTQGVGWEEMQKEAGRTQVSNLKTLRGRMAEKYKAWTGTFTDMVLTLQPNIAAPAYTVSMGGPAVVRDAASFFENGHWAKDTLEEAVHDLYDQACHYVGLTGTQPIWSKFRFTPEFIEKLFVLAKKHDRFDGLRASFITLYLDKKSEGQKLASRAGARFAELRPYMVEKAREMLVETMQKGELPAIVTSDIDAYRKTVPRFDPATTEIVDFTRLYFLNKRIARATSGGSFAIRKVPRGMQSADYVPSSKLTEAIDTGNCTHEQFVDTYDDSLYKALEPKLKALMAASGLNDILADSRQRGSRHSKHKKTLSARTKLSSTSAIWERYGTSGTEPEEQEKVIAPCYTNLVKEAGLAAGGSFKLSEGLEQKKNEIKFDMDALKDVAIKAMSDELDELSAGSALKQFKGLAALVSDYGSSDLHQDKIEHYNHVTSSLEVPMANLSRVFAVCKEFDEMSSLKETITQHCLLFVTWTMRSKQPVLPIILFSAYLDQLWREFASGPNYTILAIKPFDLIETDMSFALTEVAFKTTAGWIVARNGRKADGKYTSFRSPNPAYIEQIRDLQFGQTGSMDSSEAILWHPEQRLKERTPRYVAVGSWRTRTPDRFLKLRPGFVSFVSGPCPWLYIGGTWVQCLGLVWLAVGYAFKYTDKNKRGKPNAASRAVVASRAQARASLQEQEEADGELSIRAEEFEGDLSAVNEESGSATP